MQTHETMKVADALLAISAMKDSGELSAELRKVRDEWCVIRRSGLTGSAPAVSATGLFVMRAHVTHLFLLLRRQRVVPVAVWRWWERFVGAPSGDL